MRNSLFRPRRNKLFTLRTKVFTERDRRLLERWLEGNEETGETRKLFSTIRRNTQQLLSDLKLMNRVITELKRRRRWRGRAIGGSRFALASRLDASE